MICFCFSSGSSGNFSLKELETDSHDFPYPSFEIEFALYVVIHRTLSQSLAYHIEVQCLACRKSPLTNISSKKSSSSHNGLGVSYMYRKLLIIGDQNFWMLD
ncbi:hypothetical protein RIR_jg5518.t1 [Rhizophagus irregularis DAOM 181602=DAOM 197198]|nr:hypothetical protein RIR_jg5518.t1 [Rhizophagus irregularis DAOM 181602=DAOM 197198]